MYTLIVFADPVRDIEIYEVSAEGTMHKLAGLKRPQESITFIKNYANSLQKEVHVTYLGPKDYTQRFVSQVNELEFVKAESQS